MPPLGRHPPSRGARSTRARWAWLCRLQALFPSPGVPHGSRSPTVLHGSTRSHTVTYGSTLQALDPSLGEFVHTHSDVKIPADGGKKIYSCNEGNSPHWDDAIKQSIVYFKENK